MAFKNNALATARMMRAVCILASLTFSAATLAQTSTPVVSPAASATAAPGNKAEVKPTWSELTAGQQKVLAPLAPQWSTFDVNHKTKWLAISEKYEKMTPEQQQRLEKNINDWAKMTPEQHRLARESYVRAKKLDTEQKTALLQQYQQLSDEQKQKLAEDAKNKQRVANIPSLQSKPKVVEPLKPKKPAANHNATQAGTNHATSPITPPAQGTVAGSTTGTAASANVTSPPPALAPAASAAPATK